jgi:hypothetical protein
MNPASAKPGKLVYQVKGTKVRADLAGASGAPPGAYMLLNATSGRIRSVMPAQRMYVMMDMKAMGEPMNERRTAELRRLRCQGTRHAHGREGMWRGHGTFGGLPAGQEEYEEFARTAYCRSR